MSAQNRSRWLLTRAAAAVLSLALHGVALAPLWSDWRSAQGVQLTRPSSEASRGLLQVVIRPASPQADQDRASDAEVLASAAPSAEGDSTTESAEHSPGWTFPLPDLLPPEGALEIRLFARWNQQDAWFDIEASSLEQKAVEWEAVAKEAFAYGPNAPSEVLKAPLGHCFAVVVTPDAADVQVLPLTDVRLQHQAACLKRATPR